MSCWVAPAVAAELWHCSVEQVLVGVRDGHIPSRVDGEFLLVRIEFPDMKTDPPSNPQPRDSSRPRVNDEILTPQEMAALAGSLLTNESPVANESHAAGDSDAPDLQNPEIPAHQIPPQDPIEENEEEELVTETSSHQRLDMSQWRTARQQTGNIRRPPARAAS